MNHRLTSNLGGIYISVWIHDVELPNASEIVVSKKQSVNKNQLPNMGLDYQPTWDVTSDLNLQFKNITETQASQAYGRLQNMPFIILWSAEQVLYDQFVAMLTIAKDYELEQIPGYTPARYNLRATFLIVSFWTHSFDIDASTSAKDSDWPVTDDLNMMPVFTNAALESTGVSRHPYIHTKRTNPSKLEYIYGTRAQIKYDLNVFRQNGYRIFDSDKNMITNKARIEDEFYLCLGEFTQYDNLVYKITEDSIKVLSWQDFDYTEYFSIDLDWDIFPCNVVTNNVFDIEIQCSDDTFITWSLKDGPFLSITPSGNITVSSSDTIDDRDRYLQLEDGLDILKIMLLTSPTESGGAYTIDSEFGLLFEKDSFNGLVQPRDFRIKVEK